MGKVVREPRTWGTLVAVLYKADLSSVAKKLEKMISCVNESERVSGGQRCYTLSTPVTCKLLYVSMSHLHSMHAHAHLVITYMYINIKF